MTTQPTLPGIDAQLSLVELSTGSQRLPRSPEYTGAALFSEKPDIYALIIRCLSNGMTLSATARLSGCCINTVRAVRDRHPDLVDKARRALSDLCMSGAQLAAEAMIEDLSDDDKRDDIPLKDKAIALNILIDRHELLTGGATSRIEHVFDLPTPAQDDFNDFLRTGEGQIVDAEASQIGFGGDNNGQRAASDQGAAAADPGAGDGDAVRADGANGAPKMLPPAALGRETPQDVGGQNSIIDGEKDQIDKV